MKKLILILSLPFTLLSCKNNKEYKLTNTESLYKEYTEDSSKFINKYKGHVVEATGSFFEDHNDFVVFKYDSSTKSTYFANIIVHLDIPADTNIIPIQSSTWYYNKEANHLLNTDRIMSTDVNGVLSGFGVNRFTMSDVFRVFKDIKDGVTYNLPDLDIALHKFINDTSVVAALKNNKIAVYDVKPEPGKIYVIDATTVKGTVSDIQNYDGKPCLHLKGTQIISRSRIIDIDKLPVIDYKEVESILKNRKPAEQTVDTGVVDTLGR